MKINNLNKTILAGIASIAFASNVLADHNSPNGAGTAGMQNDIHNTVIEDDLSGTEFMEFVSRGSGADSVNRYDDDSNGNSRNGSNGGSASSGGNGGRGGRS